MTPSQFSTEISKVFTQAHQYHSPMQKKEFEDSAKTINEFSHEINRWTENERYLKFISLRLSIYEGILNDLGYFPTSLLMDAVTASAAAMRSLSLINNSDGSKDLIFHKIRQLGEGISRATGVEANQNRSAIGAYITHPTVTNLFPKATAGDCFFFNAMFYATEQAPFKGISVSPVVEHYFSRFSSTDIGSPATNIQLALERSAEDIFGNDNPLFPRVSHSPKKSPAGFFIIVAAIIAISWLIFK